jgi:hypothetical protein
VSGRVRGFLVEEFEEFEEERERDPCLPRFLFCPREDVPRCLFLLSYEEFAMRSSLDDVQLERLTNF